MDDVLVALKLLADTVAIVGNVKFPFAVQNPLVSIWGAIVAIDLISGEHPFRTIRNSVVAKIRSTPHTTQAGIVDPGVAPLLELVERFMDQKHRTQQGGRFGVSPHRDEQTVVGLLVHVRFVDPPRMKADPVIIAGSPHRKRQGRALDTATHIAQQVVPDGFKPTRRHGKWHWVVNRQNDRRTIDFSAASLFFRFAHHRSRIRCRPARTVDGHLEPVGLLQESNEPGHQLIPVIAPVFPGNGEQR